MQTVFRFLVEGFVGHLSAPFLSHSFVMSSISRLKSRGISARAGSASERVIVRSRIEGARRCSRGRLRGHNVCFSPQADID
jgi:hypothetical protein